MVSLNNKNSINNITDNIDTNNNIEDNNTEDTNTEDTNTEEDNNTEDNNTEDNNIEDNNTEDNNTENTNTEDNNTEDTNTEYTNTEDNIEDNNTEDNNTEDIEDNNIDENNNKEDNESEFSVESNVVNVKEESKPIVSQPTCGAINFTDNLNRLMKDSFDESSEYSYESIPEEKKPGINFYYIIAVIIGLFLLYYFYNGNIFLTFTELVLNLVYPYIYIPIKLYISRKNIMKNLKNINFDSI